MRNVVFALILILSVACSGNDSAHSADDATAPEPAAPAAAPSAAAEARSVPATPPPDEPEMAFEAKELPDYFIDDAIPADVRETIRGLQQRLIESVRGDDASVLQELFAPGLLPESSQEARAFFDNLKKQLADAKVEDWHDVYVQPKTGAPIFVETGGTNNVRIGMPGAGPQVYTSLQQLRGGFRDGLLAQIWVERAEGWRLLTLRIGALRLNGLDATQWFEEAKALADKGQRLPAWLRLTVADDLLESVPFVAYPHTQQARELQARLGNELSQENKFPLVLSEIPTAPEVVRIDPTFLQGSLSPGVHYVTKLSLQDSKLGDQAQAVSDALAELYPGFCHDTEHVAVAVYNEIPSDPGKQYNSAAFVANCP